MQTIVDKQLGIRIGSRIRKGFEFGGVDFRFVVVNIVFGICRNDNAYKMVAQIGGINGAKKCTLTKMLGAHHF